MGIRRDIGNCVDRADTQICAFESGDHIVPSAICNPARYFGIYQFAVSGAVA